MLYNACLYFKSKGYIVEVLTFKSGGCYIERLRQNDILVHVREKNEGFDVALIVKLRRFLKNHKYDVIHSNNYASWLYITLSSLLIFCKFNIVHTEHWIEQINTKRRLFIEKLLSKFTKKVICVSDNILDVLNRDSGICSSKLALVYNGVNTDDFSYNEKESSRLRDHYIIPDGSRVVGAIGRLVDVKNHSSLINAFAIHLKTCPSDYLIIVGNGPNFSSLQSLIDKHSIENNVLLVGQKDNIPSYLSFFDVYVMPSLSEGFSISLLESMSLGLPVIVSNVGGNKEIVKDNYNGVLIEPLDTKGLVVALSCLMKDQGKMKILGDNARQTVISNYSAYGMYNDYEKHYFG